jgi:hypothetical protein
MDSNNGRLPQAAPGSLALDQKYAPRFMVYCSLKVAGEIIVAPASSSIQNQTD